MQVFNTHTLTSKQRFTNGLISGSIACIVLGILYGVITNAIGLHSSLLMILIGYGIGWTISRFGRGVQPKFAWMGAILTIISIFIAEMTLYFGIEIFIHPSLWFEAIKSILQINLNISLNSLISILFKISAVVIAYQTSRIV